MKIQFYLRITNKYFAISIFFYLLLINTRLKVSLSFNEIFKSGFFKSNKDNSKIITLYDKYLIFKKYLNYILYLFDNFI